MTAQDLINEMIPVLKPSDSIEKAMDLMNEFNVIHLPIVDGDQYLGIVSDQSLENESYNHKYVSDIQPDKKDIFISPDQHFYQILKIASKEKTQTLPVVENGIYLGAVNLVDIASTIGESLAIQFSGGVFTLSVNFIDYSMAEISRIIESNNAKILCSYVQKDIADTEKLNVTIKVNVRNLSFILATFERFNYKIVAKFHEGENQNYELERLDQLFKFLEI